MIDKSPPSTVEAPTLPSSTGLDTAQSGDEVYRSVLVEFHGVIESVYRILSDFNEVSIALRDAMNDCDRRLRQTLSRMHSLRYKDFDRWVECIKRTHDETETDLRLSVEEFLAEQTEFSDKIIRAISSFSSNRAERLAELSALLRDFSRLQAARRDAIKTMLTEFKISQAKWHAELKAMLAKAKELRLQDVKSMFEKFDQDSKQRRLAMLARRAEVAAMLEAFRRERLNKFSKTE